MPIYHYISGNPPIQGKTTVRRNNVLCILKHRSDESYAILDRPTLNRKSFVMWGVENDTLVDAGIREISEETGYIDIQLLSVIEWEVHAEYYAWHKWVNRYSIEQCVAYRLWSDRMHHDVLDDTHHTLMRVPTQDVAHILSDVPWLSSNLLFWYRYMWQNKSYEEYAQKFDIISWS
jgi:hypothetical protein